MLMALWPFSFRPRAAPELDGSASSVHQLEKKGANCRLLSSTAEGRAVPAAPLSHLVLLLLELLLVMFLLLLLLLLLLS